MLMHSVIQKHSLFDTLGLSEGSVVPSILEEPWMETIYHYSLMPTSQRIEERPLFCIFSLLFKRQLIWRKYFCIQSVKVCILGNYVC